MTNEDRIFKILQNCNRNHNVPDIHSFKAKINGGVVWVECRGYEVYIETQILDEHTDACKKIKWVGTTVAAANRLEKLGIDLDTIDM
ncbi:MAG: hypothetical protein Q4B62_05430 [Clostridiaceae bacterium]|nr:hypothetical protein [Clostridiaceae bacterium]